MAREPRNTRLHCRAATPEDAAAVGRIIVAAWRLAYADLMPKAFLEGLDSAVIAARWEKEIASAREFRRVVLMDGHIAGASSGGLQRRDEPPSDVAELYSINLHPDCWGQGAGATLLQDAEAAMRQREFSGALLWVLSGNARARRFYCHAGWFERGEERSTSHLIRAPLRELSLGTEL